MIFTGASRLLAATVLLALPTAAPAAVILTGAGYSETFDSLIASGTAATSGGLLPNGWQFAERGTNADTGYRAGDGSANTGDTYSFGAAGSSDRALGALASGSLQSTLGVVFMNGTGAAITDLAVGFFNEQWRAGSTATPSRFAFSYRVGATDLGGTGWTTLTDLDLIDLVSAPSPGGAAVDGNTVRVLREGALTGLNIADGGSIGLRWIDLDDAGSDDALAIDDFRMTITTAAGAVPEPASWAMMIGGFSLVGGAMRRRARTAVIA